MHYPRPRVAAGAILAGLVAIGASAVPAGAATAIRSYQAGTTETSVTDPQGDVTGPLDIKSATIGGDATNATFTVETYAAFTDAQAFFTFPLDVNNDGYIDYAVGAVDLGTGAGPIGSVFDYTTGTPSTATVTVTRPSTSSIELSVPRSAIGDAATYSWGVDSLAPVNGRVVVDQAPDTLAMKIKVDVTRIAGTDRIDTGVEISKSTFPDGQAEAAVIARSDAFADALAGGPLAVAKGGPLLLNPTDALAPGVETELHRILPTGKKVYLLGGTSALSPAVESRVQTLGYEVVRIAGTDRFDTALKVAHDGLGDPGTLFVTTGVNFPDALAAGAVAGAKHGAVLLTAGSTMPQAVADYITAHPGAARYAIGGPAAAADTKATPIVGTDRYDTARKVAQTFFTDPDVVAVASGETFADALGASADIATGDGPLLLTAPDSLPAPTSEYVKAGGSIGAVYVYGGTAAVSDSVKQAIEALFA